MKKIILLLLLFALLIPTSVKAGGIDERFFVEDRFVTDGDGITWEKEPVTTFHTREDGSTYQEVTYVWREMLISFPVQHYDPSTGEIVCWDACWHEVGHKLDFEVMNRVSQSAAFRTAVLNFLYGETVTASEPHPMAWKIVLFPGFFNDYYVFPENRGRWSGYVWGGYEELYAEILDWSNGNIWDIPWSLREFYDMDAAKIMYDETIDQRQDAK